MTISWMWIIGVMVTAVVIELIDQLSHRKELSWLPLVSVTVLLLIAGINAFWFLQILVWVAVVLMGLALGYTIGVHQDERNPSYVWIAAATSIAISAFFIWMTLAEPEVMSGLMGK